MIRKTNRYSLFLLLALLFFAGDSSGQQEDAGRDNDVKQVDDSKVNPNNLAISRFQINDIKAKGIVVRLKTDKARIDAYKKAGNTKVASALEKKVQVTNMILEYGFIINWSYCPVYFMESQHTNELMLKDTLIAKTSDLQRDTILHMDHDSVYIVDYGQLIFNGYDGPRASNTSTESGSPEPGWFLVIKDGNQVQLENPMPYKAKVWGDAFTSTDKLVPLTLPPGMNDSILSYLKTYSNINELLHSGAKNTVYQFLTLIYDHVNIGESADSVSEFATTRSKLFSDGNHQSEKMIWGNSYTQAVLRLNKHIIEYYCKRLDKDKNIISRTDLLYWWLRNPNIRYLPYLRDLEVRLKKSLDKDPANTRQR